MLFLLRSMPYTMTIGVRGSARHSRRSVQEVTMSMIFVGALMACGAVLGGEHVSSERPYGQQGAFELVKDWTFGRDRDGATIQNREALDREFHYRYIYENGKLDGLKEYWSYHRDYPDGDPRSLHVLDECALTLKGRIPEGGGLRARGIESGLLRGKLPVTDGMYIEMRAKLTRGVGAWPAFWLNPGVQYPDGTFSELPWPPEIDIFEFFNWQGRERTRVMTAHVQTHGKSERYGSPRDVWSAFKNNEYVPGFDFSEDFHVFALDWQKDRPIWLLDGKPIKQTHYEWRVVPAHILVTNAIGMSLKGVDMSEMKADETQWDFVIDYIRVWRRPSR
jgi:hypothetical protein